LPLTCEDLASNDVGGWGVDADNWAGVKASCMSSVSLSATDSNNCLCLTLFWLVNPDKSIRAMIVRPK